MAASTTSEIAMAASEQNVPGTGLRFVTSLRGSVYYFFMSNSGKGSQEAPIRTN
ncbi:hypothetical protein ACU8KH_04172 [Lachancea thermotolerans]